MISGLPTILKVDGDKRVCRYGRSCANTTTLKRKHPSKTGIGQGNAHHINQPARGGNANDAKKTFQRTMWFRNL
jgi:hypothetical protein